MVLYGRAVARALCAHFLVQSSLLIECSINLSLEETSSPSLHSEDIEELKTVYNDFLTSSMTTNDAILPSCLHRLHEILLANRVKLRNECQTSRLYLQYIAYVSLLQDFITAERTSYWNLHTVSLKAMLNLFAPSGHTNYAKSAQVYIQMMSDLPTTHPWLYEKLSSGCFHSIRRSDRFWAGLSIDLAIEKVMMRAVNEYPVFVRTKIFG